MRAIANYEVVSETANRLLAEGLEPTTLAVQEHIGGGSFTTVKKYLTVWANRRASEAAGIPQPPSELQMKAKEFAFSLWAMAVAEAQRDAQKSTEAALEEATALKKELSEATAAIGRLECVEDELNQALLEANRKIREVELTLVEVRTTAEQVPKLEKALAQAIATANEHQIELTQKALEFGKTLGELEATRQLVKELKDELRCQR